MLSPAFKYSPEANWTGHRTPLARDPMLTQILTSSLLGAQSKGNPQRHPQKQLYGNQPRLGHSQGKSAHLSGPGSFAPIAFEPLLPFPDYIFRLAQKYPDREIAVILQDLSPAETEATLISITWRKLLGDALNQASVLVRTTGLAPRTLGEPLVTVSLLAQNNYQYFVLVIATVILRWTVRTPLLNVSYNCHE